MKTEDGIPEWRITLNPQEEVLKVLEREDIAQKYSFRTKFKFAMR